MIIDWIKVGVVDYVHFVEWLIRVSWWLLHHWWFIAAALAWDLITFLVWPQLSLWRWLRKLRRREPA